MDINIIIKDIPGYKSFIRVEPVQKGWSKDQKFHIETKEGEQLLLNLKINTFEAKKKEFEMMKQIYTMRIPMSKPISYGTCNSGNNVYTLLSWCIGEEATEALSWFSDTEQYALGVESGRIIKQLHKIPAPDGIQDWGIKFKNKCEIKIKKYKDCGLTFPGDKAVITYLQSNYALLNNRPQCYQHGDYHVGNMIISQDKALSIIDFNRPDYGDPWEEFNRIVWSATASPNFATGQLNGYFDGRPPLEFFKLLMLYIGSNTLSSIYWAIPFGQKEINVMMKQTQDVLHWFHDMDDPIPSWYKQVI